MNAILDSLGTGWKTHLAGIGLLGLSIYQASQGDGANALQSVLAGLAALGIRHAIASKDKPPPADPFGIGM